MDDYDAQQEINRLRDRLNELSKQVDNSAEIEDLKGKLYKMNDQFEKGYTVIHCNDRYSQILLNTGNSGMEWSDLIIAVIGTIYMVVGGYFSIMLAISVFPENYIMMILLFLVTFLFFPIRFCWARSFSSKIWDLAETYDKQKFIHKVHNTLAEEWFASKYNTFVFFITLIYPLSLNWWFSDEDLNEIYKRDSDMNYKRNMK